MKKIIFKLICYSFILWSSSAQAVWYQIELIVFENLYPDVDGELWYQKPELVGLDDAIVLKKLHEVRALTTDEEDTSANPQELLYPYTILPDDNYRMNGIYRVLRLSREYRPLFHISWQQPGYDGNKALPVHIQSEDASNLYEISIPARLVTEPMPVDFYEPVELLVDGTLKIRSNLYLYIDLDMVLFRHPPMQNVQEESGLDLTIVPVEHEREMKSVEYIRLTETRRIILNELHYFDHPMFGVILQVSRYEPE
jgi:hypothetical protein